MWNLSWTDAHTNQNIVEVAWEIPSYMYTLNGVFSKQISKGLAYCTPCEVYTSRTSFQYQFTVYQCSSTVVMVSEKVLCLTLLFSLLPNGKACFGKYSFISQGHTTVMKIIITGCIMCLQQHHHQCIQSGSNHIIFKYLPHGLSTLPFKLLQEPFILSHSFF